MLVAIVVSGEADGVPALLSTSPRVSALSPQHTLGERFCYYPLPYVGNSCVMSV